MPRERQPDFGSKLETSTVRQDSRCTEKKAPIFMLINMRVQHCIWGSQPPKGNLRLLVWNVRMLNSDPLGLLVRAAEGTCNTILPALSGIPSLEGRWMMTLFSDPFQDPHTPSFLNCQFHSIKFTYKTCHNRQNYKFVFPNTWLLFYIFYLQ